MDSTNQLSSAAVGVVPGLYRHFKGGQYEVLGVAKHSEDESEYVVYRSMKSGGLWIRPLAMFVENVDKPEYSYKGPRFQFVGDHTKQNDSGISNGV